MNNPVTGRGASLVWGPTAGLVNSVSTLCRSWTNRQILHQFINSFQIRQLLHIIEALVKSSKTTTNQTTFPIGHRLATSAPIPDQSEDSSAHKRGTSVLQGPTEVSHRGTISRQGHRHSRANRTSLEPMSIHLQSDTNPVPIDCQSNVIQVPIHPNPMPIRCRPSGNPLPMRCHSCANPFPIQCQSWTNTDLHHQYAIPMNQPKNLPIVANL